MADFSVHALFFSFCLYLSSWTHFLSHMLIKHPDSSGKFPLHLVPFHPPIYPHIPPDPETASTIFPGRLHATLNEIISSLLDSVWDILVLVSEIYGLKATLNKSISAAPASVWDVLVLISAIYPQIYHSLLGHFSNSMRYCPTASRERLGILNGEYLGGVFVLCRS